MPPLDMPDNFENEQQFRVALIGCGKMGGAMMQGWLDHNIIAQAEIMDPFPPPENLCAAQQITHVTTVENLNIADMDIIVLAVKPQIMDEVCGALKDQLTDNIPILSVAAGKDIPYFEKHLGNTTPVIRAMPNTPAAIGQGITALCANKNAQDHQKHIANALMEKTGKVLWLDQEDLMDAVTAVSGSGPAYIFYMIEALTTAGTQAGLSQEQSALLARQTVIGAAALAAHEADTPAETLRKNVTSPGGTTEAALNILMDGRFQDLMNEAITAAKNRGKELSG